MNNPGIYSLGDAVIGAPVTDQVITSATSAQGTVQALVDRLDGMTALSLQVRFAYGAGGTALKVDIETSLDQGQTWVLIARLAFATVSATKVVNLSGLTPMTTPASPGPLADDACLDGVLGDRLRAKVSSTGTYSNNTSISVRAAVR
ncbi:MAG: hypothetical protein AB7O88_24335 [Reyranellaceae bacterium]